MSVSYYKARIDGSCTNNNSRTEPRTMGIGVILSAFNEKGKRIKEAQQSKQIRDTDLLDGRQLCTNNRAEMYALLHVLSIPFEHRLIVESDSQLLVGGLSGNKRNSNLDLWSQIDYGIELLERKGVPFHIRKIGRSSNTQADRLARDASRS